MKKCFKCGDVKAITEFYAHPETADGRLGKCKECTKLDVMRRIARLKGDLSWVLSERARCRTKTLLARIDGTCIPTTKESRERWRKSNANKIRAQQQARRAVRRGLIQIKPACEECGAVGKLHMHHPDYSQPLYVKHLCTACHGKAHWKTTL